MALLYGEGQKAVLRLQGEIMKESDDLSIFALAGPEVKSTEYRGLLARSVLYFADCSGMIWVPPESDPIL